MEYGDQISVQVCFKDGNSREIGIKDLPLFVTEEKNPENEKQVRYVTVTYPSDYLKDGLILIDTPGVGSIYRNNDDETYSYLPKMDAAIFLISVDPPISRAEIEFLQAINQYSAKTFFILNKIDYLDDSGVEEALRFSEKVLSSHAKFDNPVICPLSAKFALEGRIKGDEEMLEKSRLPQFNQILRDFLMKEKGNTIIGVGVTKALNAVSELSMGINLEVKALNTPVHELLEKIDLFDQAILKMHQEQQDNMYILDGEIKKLLQELEAIINLYKEERIRFFDKEIERLNQEYKDLSSRRLMEQITGYVNMETEKILNQWLPEVEAEVIRKYEKMVSRFIDKTNHLLKVVIHQAAEIFDIPVMGFTGVETLQEYGSLFYSIGEEITSMYYYIDAVKMQSLLPRFISGQIILKELHKKTENQLDKNCGRIRHHLAEKVEVSSRRFKVLLEGKINSAISGTKEALKRAVDKKRESENEITLTENSLQKTLGQLDEIKRKLLTIKQEITTI
ncbi:dynamin family protein [Desulfofarcimen acetoxidans DSM 771]|uniref:Dynamin family protein n=1 Tax=Desulfofarcimen acetoxidans (strain ATCC 49208 / DSM 771 / KCTC 5769 / VKM B-1644 / 5575) TaxID=485916 RepID=C8VZN7_DESAS|nr:dynamin family protein [Desulfofarcimen acetoxidans]ACV63015.1 dynamin family protein [Desulfofarcimen acetoxidans DSM 771]